MFLLHLATIAGAIAPLLAFTPASPFVYRNRHCPRDESLGAAKNEDAARAGDLLGGLPTPTLLIELSLAENAIEGDPQGLDEFLQTENLAALDGCLFVHTIVVDTSVRDLINADLGSGKSPVVGTLDTVGAEHLPGGAYLGIGLSNHHVGGYYWARGMGIGASLWAHGVVFRESESEDAGGELFWDRRGADPATVEAALVQGGTTYTSSNSNDGKRSEWADFLVKGDTVQLIPHDVTKVLRASSFKRLLGVRRTGRPLGADPIVERIWKRGGDGGAWIPL